MMSKPSFEFDDLAIVQNIIRESAESSLTVYFKQSTANFKNDGSIVTEADIAMQVAMTSGLQKHFPRVLMLSEENSEPDQLEVMRSGRDYWCLDPLDGTNNFHHTLPLFSVSLALISDNHIIMAIVYDPVRQEFFSAIKGQGLWINNARVKAPEQPQKMNHSIAFVDFKRLGMGIKLPLIEQAPYKSQRNVGTCALEWAWLAAGRVQLLLHGSEKFWDYAAGYLLNSEAGGLSETIEGESVFNGSLAPRSVIAASNKELFEQWANWIRQF
jgi:myo-inositol-1(or 4)-monophosphatase